jgi:hypothetical protein
MYHELYKPMSQQVHGGIAGQLGNKDLIVSRYKLAVIHMYQLTYQLLDLMAETANTKKYLDWMAHLIKKKYRGLLNTQVGDAVALDH